MAKEAQHRSQWRDPSLVRRREGVALPAESLDDANTLEAVAAAMGRSNARSVQTYYYKNRERLQESHSAGYESSKVGLGPR